MSFRVVIVGRPNVGKSTIFNRLLGRRRSLVHDLPGMTRDVVEETAEFSSERRYTLVDTGGFDPSDRAEIPAAIRERALSEIGRADLALLVVDVSSGVLPADREAARMIKKSGRPCLVLANKIDRRDAQEQESEAWSLGFKDVIAVSAEHNLGFDELSDEIEKRLPEGVEAPEPEAAEKEIAIAIVGRPNVGKSSLVNALAGYSRSIVSDVAGTTRDSVDAVVEKAGVRLRLVDTAGIRKKTKTEQGPEVLSVVAALKRLDRCDVAVLVLDAAAGVTSQDASIAREAVDRGRALVIAVNKWDQATGEKTAEAFDEHVVHALPFARFAPVVRISALTGWHVDRLVPAIVRAAENRLRRLPTAELNRTLGEEVRSRPPKGESGRLLKVFYVSQTGLRPPVFTLVASREEKLYFSDARRLENLIRKNADFAGTPILFRVAKRAGGRRER